ncbi:MAG: outer membrane beta-barrel protein [Novosphingobium sp.]
MNTKLIALGLLASVAATPALAQDVVAGEFTGPRVGVELGVVDDDFGGTDEATYGVLAGYDADLGSVIVGATASYTGLFDDDGTDLRDLTIAGRVGAKLAPRTLVYGTVGYTNVDFDGLPGSLDGARFGVGLEQSFGRLYGNVETRYSNYELGLETYQTVVGLGFRF